MTKGKLINKVTGDTLTVEDVSEVNGGGYWVSIVNDHFGSRSFGKESWDFVEDKPSVLEQINAMPVATRFRYTAEDGRETWTYIKVTKDRVWSETTETALNTRAGFMTLRGTIEILGGE